MKVHGDRDLPTRPRPKYRVPYIHRMDGRGMASTITITHDKLARLVGTPRSPIVVDVRTDEDFAADPRILPGALRRGHADVAAWVRDFEERPAVVVCKSGAELSHGVACQTACKTDPGSASKFDP